MKQIKSILMGLFLILLASTVFSCSTVVKRYTPSPENYETLRKISKDKKIGLIGFENTKAGKADQLLCRAAALIMTPTSESFGAYVKDALKKELMTAGVFDANSKVILEANIQKIDFDSVTGNWVIHTEVTMQNTKFLVETKFGYSSKYEADNACDETASTFSDAVKTHISDIVNHPDFAKALSM